MESDFEKRVRNILMTSDLIEPVVELFPDGMRLVVHVVSSSFEGVDDAERQALMWDLFEQNLSPDDHNLIEYVFVDASRKEAA